jgi:phage gpG-like protein
MISFDISLNTEALQATLRHIQALAAPERLAVLYDRLGVAGVRWVDTNFRQGGALVGGWKPLRPLTVFGRRGGSSAPLQDTGRLRESFTYQVQPNGARVGTAYQVKGKPIPLYHQEGTGPYDIVPRDKQALAFPAPPGGGGGTYLRRRPKNTKVAGVTSARAVRAAGLRTPSGRGDIQSFAVVKKVHHPGLPPRPMLPRDYADMQRDIETVVNDWFRETAGT